jgi:hypothetical protein
MTGGTSLPSETRKQPAQPRGEKECERIQTCSACGTEFAQPVRRGRPRKFCSDCVPSGTGADAIRAWRLANPDRVTGYNEQRRSSYVPVLYTERDKKCSRCGDVFRCEAGAITWVCQVCKSAAATARKQARRRTLRDRPSDLSGADVAAMKASANVCPLCDSPMSNQVGHPRKKHLDHIVPVSVGGTHTRDNVRVICATCNLRRPHDGSDL